MYDLIWVLTQAKCKKNFLRMFTLPDNIKELNVFGCKDIAVLIFWKHILRH